VWLDLGTTLPPWDVPAEFVARYFDKPPVEDEDEEEEAEPGLDEDYTLAPLPNPTPGPLDPEDDATIMRAQRSLAAAVTYLDSGVGLLLEHLKPDDLHLIVTTDCGQPLGEHGFLGDVRAWPHEELVHAADRADAGRDEPVASAGTDAAGGPFATLLDLFGVAAPIVHGHSLPPLARQRTRA
jgi:arylsulfatase A-like enzyme